MDLDMPSLPFFLFHTEISLHAHKIKYNKILDGQSISTNPREYFWLYNSTTFANDTHPLGFIFTIRIIGHSLGYGFSMHYVYLPCIH